MRTKIVNRCVVLNSAHFISSEFGLEEWAEPSEAAEEEEAAAAAAVAAGGEDDSDMDLTYGEVEQRLDLLQQHLNRWEQEVLLFAFISLAGRSAPRQGAVALVHTRQCDCKHPLSSRERGQVAHLNSQRYLWSRSKQQ